MHVCMNLFEDGDNGQRRWEDDESADDWDVELLQRQSDRPNVYLSAVVWVLSPEEHAVGDHGEKEERHAAGDALYATERTASWSWEHRHPQVIVGHLLTHRPVEQLLKLGQVTGAGHWQNTFHHSVILFHRQPAITDEEEPISVTRQSIKLGLVACMLVAYLQYFPSFCQKPFATYNTADLFSWTLSFNSK